MNYQVLHGKDAFYNPKSLTAVKMKAEELIYKFFFCHELCEISRFAQKGHACHPPSHLEGVGD